MSAPAKPATESGLDFTGVLADPKVAIRIRWASWQLVTGGLFAMHERPDLEQDISLDLWRRLPQYDPARSSLHTFVDRLVRHAQSRLIEGRMAGKRQGIQLVPMDELELGPEPQPATNPWAETHARMELAAMAMQAGGRDRQLLDDLLEGRTVTETAVRNGMKRQSVHRRLKRLREGAEQG